jgi:hypothetical protein
MLAEDDDQALTLLAKWRDAGRSIDVQFTDPAHLIDFRFVGYLEVDTATERLILEGAGCRITVDLTDVSFKNVEASAFGERLTIAIAGVGDCTLVPRKESKSGEPVN